ncbi:cobyric acid synthase [Rhodoblastus acidophilus]|uniref:Cobyric acid synthase n=1 Tax=Rhodoblastus acidophilus TaxID=1074 RepID=A0A6N8DVF4_RHOAC|nr:cobyric acid synthase [Rhodoblastus acidophilus]MCW2276412.1 adenosylcobyric acid synthase [Rhodoblastus acidophilus]MTV33131.1 cobyric acid synthase [Rhodoblastus acidophilus]
MAARALMFQGTGSDVGKSLLVAGLCRALTLRGLKVRPFKPQNMSNNAAVAADGGEIGRAQALQARACRVEPSVHMNPVLLKPQSEIGAQVVLRGQALGSVRARDFQSWKPRLRENVLESFAHLRAEADIVLVEGAGSAAEINLRADDIANMGFARASDTPVVLIGDIDRGGVIAQIVGTRAVLDPEDAAMIQGFVVNKFRGDPTLFDAGMQAIVERSGWPSFGLVPYFPQAARLPAEDAVALDRPARETGGEKLVVIPHLPHISNFDDFDALKHEPGVRVMFAPRGAPLPGNADLIALPGSKATLADLAVLRAEGWDIDIHAHVRHGGKVLGVCGGFQMLGRRVADPEGVEGPPGESPGLCLLDVETVLAGDKTLRRCAGASVAEGAPFHGYEIHVGRTTGPDMSRPLLRFEDGRPEGAIGPSGRVRGCYVHGLFNDDRQRRVWLDWIGAPASDLDYEHDLDATLDALAGHLERHISVDALLKVAR